jgi:O-antigen/teichoic acid export membrane protein
VVAGYGVAQRAAEYGFILVKQAVNALTPSIARLDPAREPEKARFFLANASKYAGAMTAVFAVASWLLGGELLAAWAGKEYGAYGTVLGILMTAFMVIAVQMPCAAYLSLKGDHVWSSRAMSASALLNIVASVALAATIGYIGVPLGTLLASVVVDGLILPLRAYRSVGMTLLDLLRRVWLRLLAPAAAEGGAIHLLGRLLPSRDMGTIVVIGAAGAAVFLLVFVLLSLDASERRLFLGGRKKDRT